MGALWMCCSLSLQAKVSSVKFMLKHKAADKSVGIYLIVHEGEAKTAKDRIQFNAQISLVVPKGLEPNRIESFMPLNGNKDYKGKEAIRWEIESKVKGPGVTPDLDYYSIVPVLQPTSFYNNLNAGDTVHLFNVYFEGSDVCFYNIRLFDNVNDPNPKSPGMAGSQFVNTFTIGGLEKVYIGNYRSNLGMKLQVVDHFLSVDVKGSTYNWYKVGSNKILETTFEPLYKPTVNGTYYVEVVQEGCKVTSQQYKYKVKA